MSQPESFILRLTSDGPDIFLWVARMIMAVMSSLERNRFNVSFTSIIRDKKGRKMSKSLGNSPDPLDLIAKYGADALRFSIMRIAPSGTDVRFIENNNKDDEGKDYPQVEEGRTLPLLRNAARFRQMQGSVAAISELPEMKNYQFTISIFSKSWIL